MTDLFFQQPRHAIRGSPHALTDLRFALEPAGQPDIDIAVLVGRDPRLGLHVALGHHWSGFHGRMDLVPRAVEETSIDEGHAITRFINARRKVGARTALFVHDAKFDRIRRQAQRVFHPTVQVVRKCHLFGSVHLGFDHVDRAGDGIAQAIRFAEVMLGDQDCEEGIHDTFGDLGTIRVEDGQCRHQVTDIADQHDRSALLGDTPPRAREFQVAVQTTREGFAAF